MSSFKRFSIIFDSFIRSDAEYTPSENVLKSKFRGCLVGALLGDCLGAPFETSSIVPRSLLQNFFDRLEKASSKVPYRRYTDDTAMTISVAESLTECGDFNASDMAKRFVDSFIEHPGRGYSLSVARIFKQMRKDDYSDIWGPASKLFYGTGNYGNGGAMRISPVPLFSVSLSFDYNKMIMIAKKSTEITHTHPLGVNGAILQCIAIHMCLNCDPKKPINVKKFISELSSKMFEIEKSYIPENDKEVSYSKQIKLIKKLLSKDPREFELEEEIMNQLGNSPAALYSVPTAIYCFLRGQKPVKFIKTNNAFRRVLQLCIGLGGDTDTIASMAGALCGAYHGYEIINATIQKKCEGVESMIALADNLYNS